LEWILVDKISYKLLDILLEEGSYITAVEIAARLNVVLAFDKDQAGFRCRENVKKRLMGKVELWEINCKDVNNIPGNQLQEATEKSYRVLPTFIG